MQGVNIKPIPYIGLNLENKNVYKTLIFDVLGLKKSTCKRLFHKVETILNGKFIFIGTENQYLSEFSSSSACKFLSVPFSSNVLRELLKK